VGVAEAAPGVRRIADEDENEPASYVAQGGATGLNILGATDWMLNAQSHTDLTRYGPALAGTVILERCEKTTTLGCQEESVSLFTPTNAVGGVAGERPMPRSIVGRGCWNCACWCRHATTYGGRGPTSRYASIQQESTSSGERCWCWSAMSQRAKTTACTGTRWRTRSQWPGRRCYALRRPVRGARPRASGTPILRPTR
jgi:hypothetical protein